MDNNFMRWLKNNIGCILGFLVPFVILGGIFIGKDVFPFGEEMYLRSDCYHQYAPFYRELYNKLTTGESLDFSWNIGMGVNFMAVYAYYLASPVNLLLGLLPEDCIILFMDFMIVLKTALCGLTLSYYLKKRFNTNSPAVGAVAVFYALSSYMAAFSWNIMWLDCMVLLPLIVLGIDKLVNESKYKLYTISLGIAIFSNYYIAIMICIFAVLYFIYAVFTSKYNGERLFKLKKTIMFSVFSLISGGIGSMMFLPELYALSYTVSGEFSFPELWTNYFSILDMLSRSLISVPVSIFSAHDPNLYCTVAVFVTIPLFCMCSKIPLKERIGKMILIAIFLVSFNTNIPNYIWHGLHFPNSLPARESFIYIFLLVIMSYESIIHLKDFTKKQLFGALGFAVGIILLIEELYVNADYSFEIIYVSLIFIGFYGILMYAYSNKTLKRNFIVYLLFVVCIAEATINSDHEDSYKTTSHTAYVSDNEAITSLTEKVADDDNSFYRIEKLKRRTKNDAAWNNYKGVSIFSSMTSGHFTSYLGYLGFEKSTNAYSYYGFTPFTSSLLSVKYLLTDEFMPNDEWYTMYDYSEYADSNTMYLYRVNHCLPLGFMIPKDFDEDFEMSGNNPFALQNSFAELSTGYSNMFSYIPAESTNTTCSFDLEKDSDVYVYVTTYVDNISYTAVTPDGETVSDTFTGLNHRQICHFGNLPAGSTVTVTTSDSDATSLQLYAYAFNKDVFDDVYSSLNDEPLVLSEYTENSLKGTVTAKNDGVLYTSIVYDESWTAYVDGEEVEISSIENALLTIPVSSGTHTVELKYHPEGLNLGIILFVISVIILTLICIFEKTLRKLSVSVEEKVIALLDYFESDDLDDTDSADDSDDSDMNDNDTDDDTDTDNDTDDDTDDEVLLPKKPLSPEPIITLPENNN